MLKKNNKFVNIQYDKSIKAIDNFNTNENLNQSRNCIKHIRSQSRIGRINIKKIRDTNDKESILSNFDNNKNELLSIMKNYNIKSVGKLDTFNNNINSFTSRFNKIEKINNIKTKFINSVKEEYKSPIESNNLLDNNKKIYEKVYNCVSVRLQKKYNEENEKYINTEPIRVKISDSIPKNLNFFKIPDKNYCKVEIFIISKSSS